LKGGDCHGEQTGHRNRGSSSCLCHRSYQGTEKYLAPVTYYVEEPYTTHSGAIPQPEVTQYKPVAEQTYVWKERPVTLYKKVSFLEALIGGY
jgi:hypothetical protein